MDFENGKALQTIGEAEIIWDETNAEKVTGGTRRFWKFIVDEWIQVDSLKGIAWNLVDYSPFNPE